MTELEEKQKQLIASLEKTVEIDNELLDQYRAILKKTQASLDSVIVLVKSLQTAK